MLSRETQPEDEEETLESGGKVWANGTFAQRQIEGFLKLREEEHINIRAYIVEQIRERLV